MMLVTPFNLRTCPSELSSTELLATRALSPSPTSPKVPPLQPLPLQDHLGTPKRPQSHPRKATISQSSIFMRPARPKKAKTKAKTKSKTKDEDEDERDDDDEEQDEDHDEDEHKVEDDDEDDYDDEGEYKTKTQDEDDEDDASTTNATIGGGISQQSPLGVPWGALGRP